MCRKRIGEFEIFGIKIPHARQTSKMAQHNLFFYVKMYRVPLKVLARKGKKKRYYIQGEEGTPTGPGARDMEKYKGI